MSKPTVKRFEPNLNYPDITLLCLHCDHLFVSDKFKFCPYCGIEIVLQEEEKENENRPD